MNSFSCEFFAKPIKEKIGVNRRYENDDMGYVYSVFTTIGKYSNLTFSKGVDSLIQSPCFDYMVYCLPKEQLEDLPFLQQWPFILEIDQKTYIKLHADLCKKLRQSIART